MRVSVDCFDGEAREPLNLNKEQCGFATGTTNVAPSRTGTAADKIAKLAKTVGRTRRAWESQAWK